MIAQLEAEEAGDILDNFIATHPDMMTGKQAPPRFDMQAVF